MEVIHVQSISTKVMGAKLGFEHTTPGSAVNCAIDCPVKLGPHIEGTLPEPLH